MPLHKIRYGIFLIVEDDTDKRVYKSFIDRETCEIVIAHNKDNAINSLHILEHDQLAGILAIVDAEYCTIQNLQSSSPNLLYTDTHDLETMMLESPALEKILSEFGSEGKVTPFVNTNQRNVRTILLEVGAVIGYLHWLSLQENLSFKFEDLKFAEFIDKETLFLDIQKLIQAIKNNSNNHSMKNEDILENLTSLKSNTHNYWYICCGHDLIHILSIGLRNALGSCNSKDISPEKIVRALRLAYETNYFCRTRLCLSIYHWEQNNKPSKVPSKMRKPREKKRSSPTSARETDTSREKNQSKKHRNLGMHLLWP